MSAEGADWSDAKPEVVDFVLSQAEKHLQAQFETATAADGRAVTAASILAGLAGLGIASLATSTDVTPEAAWSILAGSVTMLAGASFCFLAARPVNFFVPGNQPEQWASCMHDALNESKGVEIENYQAMINDNADVLERASNHLIDGLKLALISPVVGISVYGITYLFS